MNAPELRSPIVGNRVELNIFTTLTCNLKCSYCSIAVGDVVGSQGKAEYSLDTLDTFVATHLADKEIYVTFYGGEPTLNIPFIVGLMERHPTWRYQLQTNGTLLHRLPDAVLAKLSNVLVSVDGAEHTTDHYRGRGVYRKVTSNIEKIRPKLGGKLTARVTWGHEDISFEELDSLLPTFDYVYWQFAQAEGFYDAENMRRKKAALTQLIDKFFAVDGLYPFIPLMGTVRNKVLPSRAREACSGHTQCRSSTHILNILPDGRIFPCPDLTHLPELQSGDLNANWLKPSPLQPAPEMPCDGCEALSFCRRNCMKNLYVGYVMDDAPYREQVVEPICELVKFMGAEIDRRDPHAWYAKASIPVRREISDCEIYEYVEVMP
ncbi:radical SAM protein [Azoarcus sp. KH32C]|uniref:radical SAM/SPASM domain-containing protein n=1 Tax=Azoarcus sp. KH32C TaxID=748247 RepID=UPI0002386380|nr:radical SAM protein [Azoarcus sp. KH32C]BAL23048.1 radical SAM family protein [Azoarcus sp. KH32C]